MHMCVHPNKNSILTFKANIAFSYAIKIQYIVYIVLSVLYRHILYRFIYKLKKILINP